MYEIHELASIVPLASEEEQAALTNDIKQNGQRDSAKLWRNKIVDGRCRQIACIALGIELKVDMLPDELTYDEVRKVVKSLNTRRNLTATQKVVAAHYEYLRGDSSLDEIAMVWAVARGTLVNMNYIAKNRPELVKPLFDGMSIQIVNKVGELITSNKVNTIAKIIKDVKDANKYMDTKYETEMKYSVETLPMSSNMYDWYNNKLTSYTSSTEEGKLGMYKAMLYELGKYKDGYEVTTSE